MSVDMKPKDKIFLALPCYGGLMTCGFVRGLIPTWQRGLVGQVDFLENDSLVSRARNALVSRFLRGEGGDVKLDWLMFIDVDLHFQERDVTRLYLQARKWVEKHPDEKVPIFGGMYALKKTVPQFVCNAVKGEVADEVTRLMSVRETGTGFMLIHRSTFEAMAEAMPEIAFYTDDGECNEPVHERHDFFGVGPYTQDDGRIRYLSEDYMFCQRWRDMGGLVLADTGIQIPHQGLATYPLHPADLHAGVVASRAMGHPDVPKELA